MSEGLVNLGWHHVTFRVPRTWEAVRYQNIRDGGQIALADRHGERMVVYWKKMEGVDNLERRLYELARANGLAEKRDKQFSRELKQAGRWLAWWGELGLAGLYEAESKMLLSVVFAAHRNRRQQECEEVLASYAPNTGETRLWSVFGVEARIPSDYRLDHLEAVPTLQRLRWENEKEESITLTRLGMASRLLARDSLEVLAAKHKGRTIAVTRAGSFRRPDGTEGLVFAYDTRGSGQSILGGMLAKKWHGRIEVWSRPDLERIYLVDQHGLPEHVSKTFHEQVVDR